MLLVCVMFASCSSKKSFEDLYLKDDQYCLKETKSPFTGEVIIRFKSGNISNKIEMKDGIPNGKWISYGY